MNAFQPMIRNILEGKQLTRLSLENQNCGKNHQDGLRLALHHCYDIIWRNGPYIGGHHAFIFKLNFKHIYNLL